MDVGIIREFHASVREEHPAEKLAELKTFAQSNNIDLKPHDTKWYKNLKTLLEKTRSKLRENEPQHLAGDDDDDEVPEWQRSSVEEVAPELKVPNLTAVDKWYREAANN